MIATFCLVGGDALLHSGGDCAPLERYLGLQVIHTSST